MLNERVLGRSGGRGDGIQLMVAFLSISFYYLTPGLLRCKEVEDSTLGSRGTTYYKPGTLRPG